jgi:hypothetical protein
MRVAWFQSAQVLIAGILALASPSGIGAAFADETARHPIVATDISLGSLSAGPCATPIYRSLQSSGGTISVSTRADIPLALAIQSWPVRSYRRQRNAFNSYPIRVASPCLGHPDDHVDAGD